LPGFERSGFSACLLVNLNDGVVDKRVFKIGVATHGIEKNLEHTRFGPSAEPSKLAVPFTESGRQIAPW